MNEVKLKPGWLKDQLEQDTKRARQRAFTNKFYEDAIKRIGGSSLDARFTIKYFGDEAKVYESRCLSEMLCTCGKKEETRCCYTVEEIKDKLEQYYQHRVTTLKNQTIEEFLNDQGIYM